MTRQRVDRPRAISPFRFKTLLRRRIGQKRRPFGVREVTLSHHAAGFFNTADERIQRVNRHCRIHPADAAVEQTTFAGQEGNGRFISGELTG